VTYLQIIYFPNEKSVIDSIQINDPILVLIKHDQSEIIAANIDECGEHYILLKKVGHSQNDIDKYFRIIANCDGADWTFVCPIDYKGIFNRELRIKEFYNNGTDAILEALKALNMTEKINIPKRYQRHLEVFSDY
jgi:hypothetical protein